MFYLKAGRVEIWLFKNEKRHDFNLQTPNTANRKCGLMVLGAISSTGEKFLVTVTGRLSIVRYREILEEKLVLFMEKLGPSYRFMQDNAPIHTAKIIIESFLLNGILVIAKSPDLNIIENIWG